jgi:hypothetical protein
VFLCVCVCVCVCIHACVILLYSNLKNISYSSFYRGGGGRQSLCEMFEGMMIQAVWKMACGSRTLRFWRCLQGSRVMKSENVISYLRKLLPFLQYKHSNPSPFICAFSVNANNCPCLCMLTCTLCRVQVSICTFLQLYWILCVRNDAGQNV